MIATPIDNIEDDKLRPYNCLPSFANHITILLHYYSIKLKFFILNIIAISMIVSIVLAFTIFTFSRNFQFDASDLLILMLSIKNAMSVASTVYATDCVARMVIDITPQEAKEEIEPVASYMSETTTCTLDKMYIWLIYFKVFLTKIIGCKIY